MQEKLEKVLFKNKLQIFSSRLFEKLFIKKYTLSLLGSLGIFLKTRQFLEIRNTFFAKSKEVHVH